MRTEVSLSSHSNFYTDFSSNISAGGIFLATNNVIDVGTEVDLTFILAGQVIAARGIVRWRRPPNPATPDVSPGIGIEFLSLSQDHRNAILKFIAAREPMLWDS